MVIELFISISQNGSVLTIFTFKVQRGSGFQISLDYSSKLFGRMFLIGKKLPDFKNWSFLFHPSYW